jgi:hypothetical protein
MTVDHNAIHALDLGVGLTLRTLDASFNEIMQFELKGMAGGCGVLHANKFGYFPCKTRLH